MVDHKHETAKEKEDRERIEAATLVTEAAGVHPPKPAKPTGPVPSEPPKKGKKDDPPPSPNAMGV